MDFYIVCFSVFCQVMTYTTYEKCSIKCKVWIGRDSSYSIVKIQTNFSSASKVRNGLFHDLVACLIPRVNIIINLLTLFLESCAHTCLRRARWAEAKEQQLVLLVTYSHSGQLRALLLLLLLMFGLN